MKSKTKSLNVLSAISIVLSSFALKFQYVMYVVFLWRKIIALVFSTENFWIKLLNAEFLLNNSYWADGVASCETGCHYSFVEKKARKGGIPPSTEVFMNILGTVTYKA